MAQSKSTAQAGRADEPKKVPSPEEAAEMRERLAAFERQQQLERNAPLIAELEPILAAIEDEGFVRSHEALMAMKRLEDGDLDRSLRNYQTVVGNLVDTARQKARVAGLVEVERPVGAP